MEYFPKESRYWQIQISARLVKERQRVHSLLELLRNSRITEVRDKSLELDALIIGHHFNQALGSLTLRFISNT